MPNTIHRTLKGSILVIAICCLELSLPGVGRSQGDRSSEDINAVKKLLEEDNGRDFAFLRAKSPDEKKQLKAERAIQVAELSGELIELANKYPNTAGGLAAIYWAAFLPTTTASTASEMFQKRVISTGLDQLSVAISLGRQGGHESGGDLGIARVLLDRVKREPAHEKAAELLTCVCRLSESTNQRSTAIFAESAELIASQYASKPDITNFCEILGRGFGSPPWAIPFERHLRTILGQNKNRDVRCAAEFALASVVQDSSADRQAEAEGLYQKFLSDFDGNYEYPYQGIERQYRDYATAELDELKCRATGKPAIETLGTNLDGTPMKLSDFRGKIVLLSFWATWCAPCMKFIPDEKAIAARFAAKPFTIIGVNGDSDLETAKNAVKTQNITWPSFRDERTDKGRISDVWKVRGWPTIYLIDSEGIICKRWRNDPSPAEIEEAVAHLLSNTIGAEQK